LFARIFCAKKLPSLAWNFFLKISTTNVKTTHSPYKLVFDFGGTFRPPFGGSVMGEYEGVSPSALLWFFASSFFLTAKRIKKYSELHFQFWKGRFWRLRYGLSSSTGTKNQNGWRV
jgi:hypothetical protein